MAQPADGRVRPRRTACRPTPRASRELIAGWHKRKTAIYTEMVAAGRAARPPGRGPRSSTRRWTPAGRSRSRRPRRRRRCAPCSSTSSARRRRPGSRVLAGDVVPAKKPDPGHLPAGARAARRRPARDALVIEDSRNGLLAAVGAGLRCVVTVSSYTEDEDFSRGGARRVEPRRPGGEPAQVLANRGAAPSPGDTSTLDDLAGVPDDGALRLRRGGADERRRA